MIVLYGQGVSTKFEIAQKLSIDKKKIQRIIEKWENFGSV